LADSKFGHGRSVAHGLVFDELSSGLVVLLQDLDNVSSDRRAIVVRFVPSEINLVEVLRPCERRVEGINGSGGIGSGSSGDLSLIRLRSESIHISGVDNKSVYLFGHSVLLDVIEIHAVLNGL